ncbi:carboxymuconolactone decarboxylase family protein [Saccharopolyspora indica]|uniref:carboxymuconolactone decarboxylase family protein n=1 Tax=Saccharopolyspora indica TaxID=1229659 RepID=UPI0022EB7AE4|nr:carboxymuconolactone decarboxylase family protein [Saccharopolyspora indica]MDA3643094.1 carboxymuconolactone decarboxylase family protein [Saccharopolyspora indica]
MARINLPNPATMPDADRAAYHRFPANLTRGLLRTTAEITDGYLSLGTAFPQSPLDPKLREMVILRVGALSHSAYERMQHIGIAQSAGVTDAEVTALEAGRFDELTEEQATVLRFVDELYATPKATTTFDQALKTLGEQATATVTLLVGHYMMTARFLETLDIELDAEPTSWESART